MVILKFLPPWEDYFIVMLPYYPLCWNPKTLEEDGAKIPHVEILLFSLNHIWRCVVIGTGVQWIRLWYFNFLLSFIKLERKMLRCSEQCEYGQDIPRLSKLMTGDTIVDVRVNNEPCWYISVAFSNLESGCFLYRRTRMSKRKLLKRTSELKNYHSGSNWEISD